MKQTHDSSPTAESDRDREVLDPSAPPPTAETPAQEPTADSGGDAAREATGPEVPGPAGGELPEEQLEGPLDEADEADETAGPVLGPGAELEDEELLGELAALLFATPDPLGLARLTELLRRPPRERVREALARLQERFEAAGLPIGLREVGGGWRLFTAPHQHETVQRLSRAKRSEKITPAAVETLAIVAYKQPVTKAEIEAIRGVQAGPVLRSLVDRGLVRVSGRADQPGSPLQYATTREFLDRFGLASTKDLPRDPELVRD